MRMFENPHTGQRAHVGAGTMFWAGLFGFLFYGAKGLWLHATVILVAWVLGIYAGPTGWLVSAAVSLGYAVAAPTLLANAYLRRGWTEL